MPPIALEKRELDELFDRVKRSVVVLIRSKDGNTVDFGTGFVVYVGRKTILISVDKSLIKNGESRHVRFYNNMQLNARVFMQKTLSKHAVLEVDKVPRLCPRAVTFSELEVTRENLFTVAAVHEKGDLGLMTGTLGNPNCRAVDRLGNRAYGSENKFAMSCHLAGPSRLPDPDKDEVKEPEEMTQLVGAAVFDMDCSVIGTIFCADPCSHDLKFAMKASYFVKNLEKYLKQNDQKINLSRGKKGSNLGTGLSIHHETTSESGSKKRGRTNTPRGGTGAGTSICMTQADNVEVVNKEQPRLHTYPVQGGMEGVRREAMQRALMRLVTQESDAAWRSSASSDAGIEANQCIKVFIARNTDEVGSDNSIAVKPFDLNHFFGGDGKIFGYRNLKISVWISAISFHVCADISFLEKSNGGKGITDLKLALLNIFGENLVEKDEFLQTFSKECKYISDAVMNGRVIKHSASDDGNSAVEVVRVELQAAAAAVLYSRLVPLILLLVEGSLVIDIKEHGWEMLLVVEKGTHESSRPKFQLLGFAAARHLYHYPESHLRISQILVLPPYQREYHVRHLIEAIGSIATSESVADVTIEHPPDYLQHMHCSIDCLRLLSFDPVKHVLRAMVSCLKANKMSEGSHGLQMVPPADLAETVWQKLKINLKQFLRCWETLMYLNLDAEDRESMDKMRACMYNRMKGEMLGRANMKQVASSLNEGTALACWTKEDQPVENDMTPEEEEELNQLVDKNLEEIAKVAKDLVSCGQG